MLSFVLFRYATACDPAFDLVVLAIEIINEDSDMFFTFLVPTNRKQIDSPLGIFNFEHGGRYRGFEFAVLHNFIEVLHDEDMRDYGTLAGD